MNKDAEQILVIVLWATAAAWLLFDGIFDVLVPMNQVVYLDVGEVVVGCGLFALLALWTFRLRTAIR